MKGLEAFIEVVRHGSFTAAANSLGLPKSTVSRQVAALEQELDVQLLVRTTRKLRLTEEGRRYFGAVSPAMEAIEEAGRIVRDKDEPEGVLRISVPGDFVFLPRVLTSFARAYPKIQLEVHASDEQVDLVGGDFDVAIRGGVMPDSSLVARRIATLHFWLMASREYLDEFGTPSSIEDLKSHHCLARGRGELGTWELHGEDSQLTVHFRPRTSTLGMALLASFTEQGLGIALLPQSFSETGRLIRVLEPYRSAPASVHIVYPSTRYVPAKVRAFRDHILEHGVL